MHKFWNNHDQLPNTVHLSSARTNHAACPVLPAFCPLVLCSMVVIPMLAVSTRSWKASPPKVTLRVITPRSALESTRNYSTPMPSTARFAAVYVCYFHYPAATLTFASRTAARTTDAIFDVNKTANQLVAGSSFLVHCSHWHAEPHIGWMSLKADISMATCSTNDFVLSGFSMPMRTPRGQLLRIKIQTPCPFMRASCSTAFQYAISRTCGYGRIEQKKRSILTHQKSSTNYVTLARGFFSKFSMVWNILSWPSYKIDTMSRA